MAENPNTGHVRSGDGTRIAYWSSGEGPPLVLVHGATSDHTTFRFVTPLLVEQFTLVAVDRRGRGESGDAAEYALERELDDLARVVDSLDGPVDVFGHSFGASVALAADPTMRKLRRRSGSARPPERDRLTGSPPADAAHLRHAPRSVSAQARFLEDAGAGR